MSLVGADPSLESYHGPSLETEEILQSYVGNARFRQRLEELRSILGPVESRRRLGSWLSSASSGPSSGQNTPKSMASAEVSTSSMLEALHRIEIPLNPSSRGDMRRDAIEDENLDFRLRSWGSVVRFRILRPYLHAALCWQRDEGYLTPCPPFSLASWIERYSAASSSGTTRSDQNPLLIPQLPDSSISYSSFRSDPGLAAQFLWCCKQCIDSAVESLTLLHGSGCHALRKMSINILGPLIWLVHFPRRLRSLS